MSKFGVRNGPRFATLAAAVLACGFGTTEARAAFVALPTTLDVLTTPGNFTTVQNVNELETFSQFVYSTSPANSPPAAANITVAAFGPIGNEAGLTFSGAFFAAANQVVDYKIQYVVTAPAGFVINDAFSSVVFNTFAGSTGTVSISETLTPTNGIGPIIVLPTINLGTPLPVIVNFAGNREYLVQKDILLTGGTGGVGVSIINQGFSSVPEPTSTALLGIGLAGVYAFRYRRSPRRASAA